jgi:prepilin-type N-terminal cleavage/methylation domain-containing protein
MRRSGFTLFEMVIVMVLIAIAASLAVPFVDSMMNPNQLSAAIDTVRSQCFEQARNRAMEEGRPYRVSIVEGGDAYRVEPDDTDTNSDPGLLIDGQLPDQ